MLFTFSIKASAGTHNSINDIYMQLFSHSLFLYLLLIVICDSPMIFGMQASGFKGVPSKREDFIKWTDESKIPTLKKLVARHLYRRICADKVLSAQIECPNTTPGEVKALVYSSQPEMYKELCGFIAPFRGIADPTYIELAVDQIRTYSMDQNFTTGGTIFECALWRRRSDILRLLIQAGLSERVMVHMMALQWQDPNIVSYKYDYKDILKVFLNLNALDLKKKIHNWPLMMAAATHGNHSKPSYCRVAEFFNEMLLRGADANAQDDKSGQTALMRLCNHNGCATCVRLLIKSNADIEAADDEGLTAAVFAVQKGNFEALAVLYEKGANLDLTYKNMSLLEYAKKNPGPNTEVVRLLRIAQQENKVKNRRRFSR